MIVCFDVPHAIRNVFHTRFLSSSITFKLFNFYSLYAMIIDKIIKHFDKSVWSLRVIVRVT